MGMKMLDGTFKDTCLDKVEPGEPIFVLRARDPLAAILVQQWASMARAGGTPRAKVSEALRIADDMDAWPEKKHPD